MSDATSGGQLERLRRARESRVVLQTRILSLRSGDKTTPIIVIEGSTDVPVYRCWIKSVRDDFNYLILPADGKRQILSYFSREAERPEKVYFIVDKDFDENKGFNEAPNVFCLDRYSVENYFMDVRVLESIIIEEFGVYDDEELVDSILVSYLRKVEEFLELMRLPNFYLYISAKEGIKKGRTTSQLSKLVTMDASGTLEAVFSEEDLAEILCIERAPTPEEIDRHGESYSQLTPLKEYRGKFLFAFLKKWLEYLCSTAKKGIELFSEPRSFTFNIQNLTFRALASRSELPSGFSDFIRSI